MGNAHSVKRVAHSQKRIPEKVKSACLESVRIVAKCQMGIPGSAILAQEIQHCNCAKGEIACPESVKIVAKCQMGIPESAILAPEIQHCTCAKGEIACQERVKIVAKCQNRSTQSVRIVAHGQTGIPIFVSMPEKCQKGSKGPKSHTF